MSERSWRCRRRRSSWLVIKRHDQVGANRQVTGRAAEHRHWTALRTQAQLLQFLPCEGFVLRPEPMPYLDLVRSSATRPVIARDAGADPAHCANDHLSQSRGPTAW
jgi:hypothetical protein